MVSPTSYLSALEVCSRRGAIQIHVYLQWCRQLWGTGPRPPIISFLVHFGVWSKSEWQSTIQILCSLRDQLVQMSTTHSSFDQYCISHRTIRHRTISHRWSSSCCTRSWSPPWLPHDNFQFAPPGNKSWRRHCLPYLIRLRISAYREPVRRGDWLIDWLSKA